MEGNHAGGVVIEEQLVVVEMLGRIHKPSTTHNEKVSTCISRICGNAVSRDELHIDYHIRSDVGHTCRHKLIAVSLLEMRTEARH